MITATATDTDTRRARLLALVERSPACVAAHDRAGWLELFTDDAFIEDPVGSDPARKADSSLARFWDTFIAPHRIRFEVRRDCFADNDVMRDAVIHTVVRDGVEVRVPAYLLYQLVERDGDLRIRRMAAHWALPAMSLAAMRLGPRGWVATTGLFARMVRVMGVPWVSRYVASMANGVGARGLRALDAFGRAAGARDVTALSGLFVPGGGVFELGDRRDEGASGVLALFPDDSSLEFDSPVAAGRTVAARFRITGSAPHEGVALLELEPGSARIRSARLFTP